MGSQWFDIGLINERPGLVSRLLEQEFEVVRPWRHLGGCGANGRPVLLPWRVGARGVVVAIHYRNRDGWRVLVEYHGDWQGMSMDECWPEIPLQEFLHCSAPLSATGSLDTSKEAANDA
jgi:hypothetical protein